MAVRDAKKENASEQESVRDFVATEKDNGNCTASTDKKNTEANTKVCDLNQTTMQALDVLAEEYGIFEETIENVTDETEEGDMLFAVAYELMEELDKAQNDQDHLQDELEATRESMGIASKEFTNCWAHLNTGFREVSNCRALHDVMCVDLKNACQRTAELKRKADDAHERTRSHRERCRRATKEHTKSPKQPSTTVWRDQDELSKKRPAPHTL